MDTTTLSSLHTIMVNIDESESVDEAVNHDLDGEESLEQWKDNYNKGYHPEDENDSPKASEIGLSKDFPDLKGGEDGLGPDGDSRHDRYQADDYGDDPWGIGEADRDVPDVPDDIQIGQDDDLGPPDDIQLNERDVREMTNKIYEEMDEGILDPRAVAEAALSYLSEADVAEMARINEWFMYDDDEDDDEPSTAGYQKFMGEK